MLGVTQFEKTRIAFALSFLKEEVGAHRQMGGGAISRFHSTTREPAPASSLWKGASPENSVRWVVTVQPLSIACIFHFFPLI
jgi:hypothetical protein